MTQAAVNNGEPRRDWVEYDHPDGAYTLLVHKVTKDTEGSFTGPGNVPLDAREGQYVVKRDNFYEVHDGDAFDEFGLEAVREQEDLDPFAVDEPEEEKYNPNDHTAAEVRRYLRNPELTDEERTRVEDAERDGQNRASAFPR
jgi:hypothetical protein